MFLQRYLLNIKANKLERLIIDFYFRDLVSYVMIGTFGKEKKIVTRQRRKRLKSSIS